MPYFFVANSDYLYNICKGKKIVDVVKTETEEDENTFQFAHPLVQHGNQNLTLTSSTGQISNMVENFNTSLTKYYSP